MSWACVPEQLVASELKHSRHLQVPIDRSPVCPLRTGDGPVKESLSHSERTMRWTELSVIIIEDGNRRNAHLQGCFGRYVLSLAIWFK